MAWCVTAAVAVAYLLFAVKTFSNRQQATVCTNLELIFTRDGNKRLIADSEIEAMLHAAGLHPVGKKRNEINTELIEETLGNSELIKSVECYLTPSGVARMRICQRVLKFHVVGSDNYYVDNERCVVHVPRGYAAYLPVVTGSVTREMASGEIFDFVTFLESNSFWNAQVEQIHIRPDKMVELVPRVGDSIILLGELDGSKEKLAKLQKLYTKGFNVIGWNRYKTVDLRFKGQVVCTRY